MALTRSACWTLLVAAGFALLTAPLPAPALQKEKDELPRKGPNYTDVITFKGSATGIPASELPKAKESFAAFAKYNADIISHPKVYSAPQEFRPDSTSAPPPPPTLDAINA